MRIVLTRTGDPWMDWGLVALAQLAEENADIFDPVLDSGVLQLNISDPEEAKRAVLNYLRQQINNIVLLPVEAKLLGYQRQRDESGYYDPGQTWNLDEKELDQALESFRRRHAKLQNKQPDAEDLRVPSLRLNKTPEVSLKRNYPGIKNDWRRLKDGLEGDVTAFFSQWQDQNRGTPCSLCGRLSEEQYGMRQNKNPFYNQHHNNVVRGHRSTYTVGSMCSTCNFLNVFASACADLPYFVEGKTHILAPRVDDLTVLLEVRKLVRNNSLDLDNPLVVGYKTNIRDLPGGQADLYTSLIGVYWNLKHKYTYDPQTGLEDWGFGLSPAQQAQVEKWVVFRFTKGTNVNFADFNIIHVDSRLFKLVETVRYGKNQEREGDLYRSLLKYFPAGNSRSRELFSKGLVTGNWRQVGVALFTLLKEKTLITTAFAPEFIDYALEVDKVLPKELLDDVRVVAGTIGRIFANDVGLMTSINNAHDEASLRRVLKDAFLKMHKIAATTSRFGGDDVWAPKESRVENILGSVTKDNVAEIRDTLLIYASLAAMHKLRSDSKSEQGGNA